MTGDRRRRNVRRLRCRDGPAAAEPAQFAGLRRCSHGRAVSRPRPGDAPRPRRLPRRPLPPGSRPLLPHSNDARHLSSRPRTVFDRGDRRAATTRWIASSASWSSNLGRPRHAARAAASARGARSADARGNAALPAPRRRALRPRARRLTLSETLKVSARPPADCAPTSSQNPLETRAHAGARHHPRLAVRGGRRRRARRPDRRSSWPTSSAGTSTSCSTCATATLHRHYERIFQRRRATCRTATSSRREFVNQGREYRGGALRRAGRRAALLHPRRPQPAQGLPARAAWSSARQLALQPRAPPSDPEPHPRPQGRRLRRAHRHAGPRRRRRPRALPRRQGRLRQRRRDSSTAPASSTVYGHLSRFAAATPRGRARRPRARSSATSA